MNATSTQNPAEGTSTSLISGSDAAGASIAGPATAPEPLFRPVNGESDRAFEAFCAYLELGPKRRYATVAKKVGVSLRTVRRWANDFDWRARIAAHAAQVATQYSDSEAALHRDEVLDSAARDKSFRDRQFAVAEAILDAAERFLERADLDDLDSMTFADACKALEVASRIARQTDVGNQDNKPQDSALRQQLESLLDQAYGGRPNGSRDPIFESPEDLA